MTGGTLTVLEHRPEDQEVSGHFVLSRPRYACVSLGEGVYMEMNNHIFEKAEN